MSELKQKKIARDAAAEKAAAAAEVAAKKEQEELTKAIFEKAKSYEEEYEMVISLRLFFNYFLI